MNHLPTCVYNIQGNIECQSGCGRAAAPPVGALDYKKNITELRAFDSIHIGAPDYGLDGSAISGANVATMAAANIDGSYAGFFKQTQLPSM